MSTFTYASDFASVTLTCTAQEQAILQGLSAQDHLVDLEANWNRWLQQFNQSMLSERKTQLVKRILSSSDVDLQPILDAVGAIGRRLP